MVDAIVGVSPPELRAQPRQSPENAAWFHSHRRVWVPFSERDTQALEEAWSAVRDELELREPLATPPLVPVGPPENTQRQPKRWFSDSLPASLWPSRRQLNRATLPPPPPPPMPTERTATPTYRRTDPDEPAEKRRFKVAVLEDKLFDVDLAQMTMYPALWAGYDQEVLRATWFYVAGDGAISPIAHTSPVAADVERAYEVAQPWQLSLRLRTLHGSNDASEQLYDLPNVVGGAKIAFDDAYSGRVFLQNISSKLFSFLPQARLVRGFSHAQELSERLQPKGGVLPAWQTRNSERGAAPAKEADAVATAQNEAPAESSEAARVTPAEGTISSKPHEPENPVNTTSPWVTLSEAFLSSARAFRSPQFAPSEEADNISEPPSDLDDDEEMPGSNNDPPHLLFCIHGIGQKLSEDWSSMHFVHDLDRLRSIMRTQMQDPDLSRQLSGGRVKLIPICWRRNLEFDPDHGKYTLTDLTNDKTIPTARIVVTKVLLDIPLYFSRHHDAMTQNVLFEMNRLYRLFVQRNPDFESSGGRVSILGHSLGSMLAADLLVAQPTVVPPLHTCDAPRIHHDSKHLLFNVTNFFCIGSPLSVIWYMGGAQLVARRREGNDDPEATSESVGTPGCLAVKAIYNVYAATDPVSFQMSATADAPYARIMRPVQLPRDAAQMPNALEEPRVSVGKLAQRMMHGFSRADSESGRTSAPSSAQNTPRALPIPVDELESGERRFRALNPNGCIDYVIDVGNLSSFSQYLDMLGAHMSYWTSITLANFLLRELIPNPQMHRETPRSTSIPELLLEPSTERSKKQAELRAVAARRQTRDASCFPGMDPVAHRSPSVHAPERVMMHTPGPPPRPPGPPPGPPPSMARVLSASTRPPAAASSLAPAHAPRTPLPCELSGDARHKNYQTTHDPQLPGARSKEMHRRYETDPRAETSDPRRIPRSSKPRNLSRKPRRHLEPLSYKYDKHSVGPPPPHEIVISGLSPLTMPNVVLQHCRAFGTVESSELKVDPQTGQSIGIMWVCFASGTTDAAEAAAAAHRTLHGMRIGTETVQVVCDRERAAYVKQYRTLLGERHAQWKQERVERRERAERAVRAERAERAERLLRAERAARARRSPPRLDSPRDTLWDRYDSPHRATTSSAIYYGRARERRPPRREEAGSTARILRRLAELGHAYIYVPRLPSGTTDAATMRAHFAGFSPALIESDETGWYIGFHSSDAASRCQMVLGTASLNGHQVRLDVRPPPSSTVHGAQTEPAANEPAKSAKTSWTRDELLDEARRLLLDEFRATFLRDVKTRFVTPIVTQFLRPDGTGGIRLAQHKAEMAARPAAARSMQLPSFRRLGAIPKRAPVASASAGAAADLARTASPRPRSRRSALDYSSDEQDDAASDEAPATPPDPIALGVTEDAEEMYLLQQVLEYEARGAALPCPGQSGDGDGEHATGSARSEGFYRIPPAEKAAHLPDRNRATVDAAVSAPLVSARNNRADSRRLALGIEQHRREMLTDTDILNINQLQTRKKQLRFAKSPIHDWGLYAMEQIPPGDMVIEYVGEIVRQQVADHREKLYERAGNFSTYLFRVDDDVVVDATHKGNIARLMNHSCTPNCTAKILTVQGEKRIVLFAKQLILPGQELTYDYKFQAAEDDEDAIPCLCGSPACRRFL